ncbi:MAG: hypothetical protein U0234_22875 [Sandaracinus sp.]
MRKLFADVWKKVPADHRIILERGWRSRAGRPPARLEVTDLSRRGADVSTDVDDYGRTLTFDASLLARAHPSLVRAGIAFLLACASVCITERTRRMNGLLDFVAFARADLWGFGMSERDERVLDKWVRDRVHARGAAAQGIDRRAPVTGGAAR